MLQDFSHSLFLIVAGLFPIINPPGSGFIVLSLVPHATSAERAELARRIAINSFAILFVSLSVGAYVLAFFGISIPVLRVAGGLVVAKAGWDLLQAAGSGDDGRERTTTPVREPSLRSRAFYPLTLPITVGPGSISVAIALGTGAPTRGPSLSHLVGVGVALLLLAVSIYLCVRFAARIGRMLGTAGTEVAARLFSFVMLCIGVQILWLGVSGLLETVP